MRAHAIKASRFDFSLPFYATSLPGASLFLLPQPHTESDNDALTASVISRILYVGQQYFEHALSGSRMAEMLCV